MLNTIKNAVETTIEFVIAIGWIAFAIFGIVVCFIR